MSVRPFCPSVKRVNYDKMNEISTFLTRRIVGEGDGAEILGQTDPPLQKGDFRSIFAHILTHKWET